MAFWNRRKPIDQLGAPEGHRSLNKTLSWPHLVGLGVGAIVGTGIYTLIGVGADRAGPAVMLAFVLAGVRSGEHTSEIPSRQYLVFRLLLLKKKRNITSYVR